MAKRTKVKTKTFIEIADDLAEEGQVIIKWDGGNDSGGVWMEVNGDRKGWSDEYSDIGRLIGLVENELDYGSWAGEFHARGEMVYDPKTKIFKGNDHMYYDNHAAVEKCKIKIELPDILWFDSLDLQISGYIDDIKIEATFFTRVGLVNPKLGRWEEILKSNEGSLHKQLQETYGSVTEHEVESFWETKEINFNQFEKDGNKYVTYITELGYTYGESEDKSIVIDLHNYK